MRPLADGIRVALRLEDGREVLLTKRSGRPELVDEGSPPLRDVQFQLEIPRAAAAKLAAVRASDVPTIAVALVDLLTHADPTLRIRAKVHAGLFELLRKGYLSVIPLGGAPLMRALGERGIGSLSEIRERLKRSKENR